VLLGHRVRASAMKIQDGRQRLAGLDLWRHVHDVAAAQLPVVQRELVVPGRECRGVRTRGSSEQGNDKSEQESTYESLRELDKQGVHVSQRRGITI